MQCETGEADLMENNFFQPTGVSLHVEISHLFYSYIYFLNN